jgi:hypothetical protein
MKSPAEPKVYVESERGDFDFAQFIGFPGTNSRNDEADARGRARVRALRDSPRLFKPLRTPVRAGLSQIRHIALAPAAETKDFPD